MTHNLRVGLVRGFVSGARLLAPLVLFVGCQEEGPFLQTEEFLTKAGEDERYMGGSCMGVTTGNGMGGGTAPGATSSYQYSYESKGNGVRFVFNDAGGEVLEERNYDAAFIASGRRDEVVVEVGGEVMRFVNWGTQECGTIRDPDPEP